jgi:CRP-like cAMP-binding protein
MIRRNGCGSFVVPYHGLQQCFMPLSEKELEKLMNNFEPGVVPKKTTLVQAGKAADEIYYLRSGCIRLYYLKEGVDISAYFFTEKMFAGAYDSFITQTPSRHYLETTEDCDIRSISYPSFQRLLRENPEMNTIVRKILEERFVDLHNLFTSQILDSPEERYRNLMTHRPDLLNRIPQHQLATFLGVTPVSLSRIRKRISKK